MVGPVETLDTVLYSRTLAGTYLGMNRRTLDYWLDGGEVLAPVVDGTSASTRDLTWGQFVECWYVRQYRLHGVPLDEIRAVARGVVATTGIRYPLAYKKFYVAPDRHLGSIEQAASDASAEVVLALNQQLALSPFTERFLTQVDFDSESTAAISIHPNGTDSAVSIDPLISFGAPQVKGVRTENLAELVACGEPADIVAADFGLELKHVQDAVGFEWGTRKAAA